MKVCKTEGCGAERSSNSTLCNAHLKEYRAAWHAANRDKVLAGQQAWRARNEGKTHDDGSGYIKYVGFNHPACSPKGVTRYHRIVLWDKLEGKDAPCDECGIQLYWSKTLNESPLDALCVDHLDENRSNNDPSNLVPICSDCNNARAKRNRAARKENVNV